MKHFETKLSQKVAENIECELCHYITSKIGDFKKHLLTRKHIKRENETLLKQNETKSLEKSPNYIMQCICGITFYSRTTLWRHKKVCLTTCVEIKQPESLNYVTPDLVMELIKDNKEMKQIILEQNNTINNLVKNGVSNNHNNNTNMTNSLNNNKTFNLQFFLNETCKDAMNITEFVESIKIQLGDLEKMGEVGYIEGLSNIITSNLRVMDITERPVHCTDKKREIIYIKDHDKWEKEDDNKTKLRKAIKKIASKNYKLLPEYREKYPGCQYAESKHGDKYNKMMVEVMGGKGDDDMEKENKIIHNISKNIIIEK
jgi:hypothetical protein